MDTLSFIQSSYVVEENNGIEHSIYIILNRKKYYTKY